MENKEKLMLVFDFLADYLTNDSNSNDNTTLKNLDKSSDKRKDTITKSYDIMKKMDEMDKTDAKIKSAVNNATKPLKEVINKVKTLFNEEVQLDKKTEEIKELTERFTQKTGVTLDNEGKVVEVKVEPLRDYVPISEVMDDIGPSLNEIREQDMEKTITKSKKLKSVLNDAKSSLDK